MPFRRILKCLGPDCEIVIHDLKTNDPEHSIVYIENGHVTGRGIGDGPSNAVFDVIRHNNKKGSDPTDEIQDHPGYLMKTSDGKILKCSTSYIRDDDGSLHYVFGINYDITKLTMIESALHSLITPVNKEEKPKVTAIQFLNDSGAFLITKSGDKVASYFGISKIYSVQLH